MEGVSSETSSLAGHLQLNNLIAFWDDNRISIDGDTAVSFTENVPDRYRAYGWNVLEVPDANTNIEAIAAAVDEAKKSTDKPTLIRLVTTIGYGSLKQGSHDVHGSPLKPDDIKQLKKSWGFKEDVDFFIPEEVSEYLAKHVSENQKFKRNGKPNLLNIKRNTLLKVLKSKEDWMVNYQKVGRNTCQNTLQLTSHWLPENCLKMLSMPCTVRFQNSLVVLLI